MHVNSRVGRVVLLGVLLAFLLGATPARAASIVIENPDALYLAETTRIDLSGIPNGSSVVAIGDGSLQVGFDQDLQCWNPVTDEIWGNEGQVEEYYPAALREQGRPSLTLDLSEPVSEFGFEASPYSTNLTTEFTVTFIAEGEVVGTITRSIFAPFGNFLARLFALRSDVPFDQVGISIDNSEGICLSQVRYAFPSPEVNTPPVLAPIGDKSVDELSLLSFTATATDTDIPADTLTFSLGEGAPEGASITTGGAFTWTPTEAQGPGSYSITVIVSDGTDTDTETITVTVNDVTEPTTIDLEHDAAGVVFDRFVTGYSTAYSGGGYVYGRWTGTVLKASFTGSSLKWIGPKQPGYGMADVWIDGALAASDVDCYMAGRGSLSELIWESATLADGPHTIELRLMGNKNAASSGNVVVLDKFEVTGSAPLGGGTRYDDSLATPGYTGTWLAYANPTYFNKTYAYSRWTNAAFTVDFTGTRVSWIGPRTPNYGMADVFIDDVKVATVDCYRANLATQGWREVVWESGALAPGAHTISIRPTGTKNPAATAANVVVDAIDVVE